MGVWAIPTFWLLRTPWLSFLSDRLLVTFLTAPTKAGQKQLEEGCWCGHVEGTVQVASWWESMVAGGSGLLHVHGQHQAAGYIIPSQEAELALSFLSSL